MDTDAEAGHTGIVPTRTSAMTPELFPGFDFR